MNAPHPLPQVTTPAQHFIGNRWAAPAGDETLPMVDPSDGKDFAAIAQEIVRTAGRSDISEEVVRFRAHLAHWTALTESEEPSGRKFDFLLQEMNREVNTIGSKADGLAVTELIVNAKAELEKMKEQVQNVE